MSTIITRNSANSGSTPSSLVQGELAINVTDGRLFYGSGSGNVVKEFTGSASGGTIDTGSFATTGSNTFIGNQTISGTLHQSGTFFPDQIDWFSSSIGYDTGSYILTTTANGLTTYANYQDVATIINSGLLTTSSFNAYTGSSTSQFAGTASYATNALSASYAISASYEINYETSSSYADFAVSASHATQADNAAAIDIYSFSSPVDSYLLISNVIATTGVAVGGDTDLRYNSSTNTLTAVNISATSITGSLLGTASYATTALSSSYADFAVSASHALTASFITASNVYGPYGSNSVISASYAATASYALNGGVTQLLAGSNVILSPTNGLGQVTVSATLSGSTIFNTATGSYGSFYDTTTQTNPVANVARSMSFNSTDITNGVSISGSTNPFNTYIKTENAGIYNIQFSAQVEKTDSGTDEIDIWLRKNGINLTDSATKLTLSGNGTKVVAAWNWFVSSATGDYYQIIWSSADTGMRLYAEPLSGIHPGIPSVILTANRVDQFLSNTGSFSGSFTGNLIGTASYATQALSASYILNAVSASYATQALSSSFALTASYILQAVSASYAATSSYATQFKVATGLTASGLIYPSADNGNESYIQTDGAGNLSLQYVKSMYETVRNRETSSIIAGIPLFVSGATGANSDVYIADASNPARMPATYIASETIAPSGTGKALISGLLTNINTTAYQAGQEFFVNTGSGITTSRPPYPNSVQVLGIITRVGVNGQAVILNPGQIEIQNIQPGYTLVGNNIGTPTAVATASLSVASASFATTASYVLNAVSASFASTASSVNTLNQNVLITGSLTVGATTAGASENTLTLGPRDNGSEGGQLMLQAPGGTYTSASMWDNYANQTRLLRGSNAGSDAMVASFNMHTKQVSFPQYNSPTAFTGTTLVGLLGFDNSGNLITTTTSSGGGGGGVTITNNVDNYVITATGTANTINGESNMQFNGSSLTITGQITSSGAIISTANGAMYFRGGDDAEFWDINVANTVGIYGQQDTTIASIKLGSGGGIISGKSGNIGINNTNPTQGTLDIVGNVYATSFTGSLQGTASYATQALSSSYALNTTNATTASFINPLNQPVVITGSLRGQVSTLSISSNTASVDMSTNNFFTLALVNGANTHINPTNINPGQTVNIRVTQGSLGTGTVSFPSFVDQPSGSAYTGSQIANAIDIVTMITFDSTNVYVSSVRNMI